MTPERFWLVGTRGRVAVIHDETEARELASGGVYEASGPYVPETEVDRLPRRNDEIAAWIKRMRDEYGPREALNGVTDDAYRRKASWRALDRLLDRYRECADCGLTLRPEDDTKGDP